VEGFGLIKRIEMKKRILPYLLTILLFPNFTTADRIKTFEIKGVIGDYAPDARVYEVNGKIYEFGEDIAIQTRAGTSLTFHDLKGGMAIKIVSEERPGPDGKIKIEHIGIIVMNEKIKLK